MKNTLEINEDNYKGYVELYKAYNSFYTEDAYKYTTNLVRGTEVGIVTAALTGIISYFGDSILPTQVVGNCPIVMVIVGSGGLVYLGYQHIKFIRKLIERKKQVKESYPDVDISFGSSKLKDALMREKILVFKDYGNCEVLMFDVESYEKMLIAKNLNDALICDDKQIENEEQDPALRKIRKRI